MTQTSCIAQGPALALLPFLDFFNHRSALRHGSIDWTCSFHERCQCPVAASMVQQPMTWGKPWIVQMLLYLLVLNAGNGWEWGNGTTIKSYHSLIPYQAPVGIFVLFLDEYVDLINFFAASRRLAMDMFNWWLPTWFKFFGQWHGKDTRYFRWAFSVSTLNCSWVAHHKGHIVFCESWDYGTSLMMIAGIKDPHNEGRFSSRLLSVGLQLQQLLDLW